MAPSIRRSLSPTLSEATTRASDFEFDGKVITRADLRTSVQAYEQLITANRAYRTALLSLSVATATFADAIQACASLKGAEFTTASRNSTSAGFHHLFANHLHILADSMDKQFERPLEEMLATYRTQITERSATYEKSLRESSRIIRQAEERNIRLGRTKERNMASFKATLVVLQNQVQEIDRLKAEHYREVEDHEQKFADSVQGKVAVAVRSTFEIFERLTAKSTDPILETMLQSIPDPFDSYGSHETEDRLFSVLQPLSLISDSVRSASTRSLHSDHTSRLHHPTWVPSAAPEDHEEPDAEDEGEGSGDGEDVGHSSSSTDESTTSSHGFWTMHPTTTAFARQRAPQGEPREAASVQRPGAQDDDTLDADSFGGKPQSPSGTIRGRPPSSHIALS